MHNADRNSDVGSVLPGMFKGKSGAPVAVAASTPRSASRVPRLYPLPLIQNCTYNKYQKNHYCYLQE